MSANKVNTLGVWLMIGLVGALAWVAIAQDTTRMWAYLIAMGFLPASMMALSISGKFTRVVEKSEKAYRLLRVSLIGAGAVLAGSLGMTIAQNAGYVSEGVNADILTGAIIAIWWVVLSLIIHRSKDRAGGDKASN